MAIKHLTPRTQEEIEKVFQIMKKEKRLCDENCNECPIINHPNSKILTKIFNELYNLSPNYVYNIVESICPNLTVCYNCHIDDFCHIERCKLK
jgi:hypothetical protein